MKAYFDEAMTQTVADTLAQQFNEYPPPPSAVVDRPRASSRKLLWTGHSERERERERVGGDEGLL